MFDMIKQIEADVVLFAVNREKGIVTCQPMWECTLTETGLYELAAKMALQLAEKQGGGCAIEVHINDYR